MTSLATARPVAGAEVTVEGVHHGAPGGPRWEELFRGRTDARGFATWAAPGSPETGWIQVERIAVAAGGDRLVLDPDRAPDAFADNRWNETGESWLQWTQQDLDGRAAPSRVPRAPLPRAADPPAGGAGPSQGLRAHARRRGAWRRSPTIS